MSQPGLETEYQVEFSHNGSVIQIDHDDRMFEKPVYRDRIVAVAKQNRVDSQDWKAVKAKVYKKGLLVQIVEIFDNSPSRSAEFPTPGSESIQ